MTNQILLTLLNCSWQWGLLGGLTWLIARRFRHTNSTSHVLWLLFLLSLPILFILNQFVPAISINTTVPELTQTQVQPVHISSLAAQDDLISEVVPTEIYTQSQGHTVTKSQFSFNWTMTDVVLCIWAIGTLAMLVRVAFGLYRIRRIRQTATVAGESYQAICKRLAQKLNINRPVTVCFSDRVVSPISFGWLSPHILIPRKMDLSQFELVAAHELAHVQRLDWLTNLFSHFVGAIFFFHPIYYFLNRKLVHLREQICDDWVIQLTGARKKYAQCLLDLVRHENRAIPFALTLNQTSQLESRIDSILKHNSGLDLKPKRRLLILATSLLIICVPLLSTAQFMPLRTVQLSLFGQTSDESEKADEKVEKKLYYQKKMMEMNQDKLMQIDREGVKREGEPDRDRNPSPEEHIKRDEDEKANLEDRQIEREGERERKRPLSAEEPVKQFDKDGDGNQENVTIPDANLAAVVREALGLGPNAPIPKKKLETLETLRVYTKDKKDIGYLTGLEKATGLKTLIIRGYYGQKKIEDITPLAGLTQLTKLDLSGHNIKDIKPLAGLTQLKDLSLNNTELIHDLAPISGLKHLIHLSLWNNKIRDITQLAELTQLISLRIFMNEISDITPVANLKQLIHLDISMNEISDITAIANLTQLTGLRLKTNQISDITPITNLKHLTGLELESNRIHDITPLSGLKQLTLLWLSNNQISDITPLTGLTQLTSLYLSNNPIKIRDMGPLRMLLKQQPDLEIDIAIPPAEEHNRFRTVHVEVKNPAEFKKVQEKVVFSGPQPGEKLPPLEATAINGEAKGKTFDFIAKADGQPLVLILQDETPLGLRGLVGFTRLLAQIDDKSKQKFHVHVVFLGDSANTLAEQVSQIVTHIPSNVLLGISQDGRKGPGKYGLNSNVAQTILIVKDGKVLHNFPLTKPMLSPDPYVLGAVGELIGEKPTTLEKWLNVKTPVIKIKKPAEGEEIGKILLNGTVVKFDVLLTLLRNLPEEQKSTLIISSEPDVPHEQIVKVMDLAKEAGMEKIGFALSKNGENPINDRTTITFTAKNIDGDLKQSTEIKGFTKGKAILIVVENKIDAMTATIIGAIPVPIDASIRALIESETDDPFARSVVKETLTCKGKGYTGFTVGITIEDDTGEIGQSKGIEDFPVGNSIVIGFHNKDDPTVKPSIASFMKPVDTTIRALIDKMEEDR